MNFVMHSNDNVATCLQPVQKGEKIIWNGGEIVARETIPACHKVAIKEIRKGEMVIKYGETIGKATKTIPCGGWVNDHNITGILRDYDDEFVRE